MALRAMLKTYVYILLNKIIYTEYSVCFMVAMIPYTPDTHICFNPLILLQWFTPGIYLWSYNSAV